MDSNRSDRRRFLKSAALAGLAVGAERSASGQSGSLVPAQPKEAHGEPSHFVMSESGREVGREVTKGITHTTYYTPLADSMGIITPAPLHFMQAHSRLPDIDPQQWRLTVHGMVERPLTFTLDELKRLPRVSRIRFLECLGNSSPARHGYHDKQGSLKETVQYMYGITSCSEWTGVPLSVVLKETGLQKEGTWLVAEGSDSSRYTYCIPITKAMDDVLLAYGQNGEPVRPEQGFPVRLLVPGWGANHSVKWLRQIKVVDRPYMTWDQSVHHTVPRDDLGGKSRWYNFVWPPKSVILRPSGGQQLPGRGYYEITGLAWSGGGAIRRVEVSIDGGKSWKDAKIQDPVLPMAHTRFSFDWTWDGEEAVLQSRCTDDRGEVQPSRAQLSKNFGHADNNPYQTTNDSNHWNAIQPWKVGKDGSVHDAMFT
jgi:sulfane dehydrogenase subunit SoxC